MKQTWTPRELFEENVDIDKLRQAVINANVYEEEGITGFTE